MNQGVDCPFCRADLFPCIQMLRKHVKDCHKARDDFRKFVYSVFLISQFLGCHICDRPIFLKKNFARHVEKFHSERFHANLFNQNFAGANQNYANVFPNDDLPNDFNDDLFQPVYNNIALSIPNDATIVDAVAQSTKLVYISSFTKKKFQLKQL